MLSGIVSPIRPLLTTLIFAFGLSLESSGRITSGYVAAERSTQSPTVEDEPIATIFSGSPDFRRFAVRGNRAPNERSEFTARHASAGSGTSELCESAPPDKPPTTAAPTHAIPATRNRLLLM